MSEKSYRLDQHITPTEYNIRIIPIAPDYNKFIGRCIIGFKVLSNANSNYIITNGSNLKVTNVTLCGTNSTHKHISTTYDTKIETQQIKFEFDSIPTKLGVITIEYEGLILTDLTGFYKCMQDNKITMLTTFEPVSARKCFPCFDEPHFKAKFKLEIVAPINKVVLSNTDIESIIPFTTTDNLYIFKQTPIMSTYLVAYYIGDATYVESFTKDLVRIRIYSSDSKNDYNMYDPITDYDPHTPLPQSSDTNQDFLTCLKRDIKSPFSHLLEKPTKPTLVPDSRKDTGLYSKLALDTAVKCMDYMTEYFDIRYPLEKLDLISVPEFAMGAMENWGLVTFRELFLICDPNADTDTQINVVYTICHELAHQWFGNLVTMSWWSELWLNESFATWLGWLVVDYMYPKWNINDKFYYDNYINGLNVDSLENSHPIKVDVTNPSDIKEIFDTITYKKGSAVVKMLVKYIGENDFKSGIRLYMKKYAYLSTTTDNLWDCLEFISGKDISKFMHNWIYKKNYPLVTIVPHGKTQLQITQSVFSFNESKSNNLWIIPLTDNILLEQKEIIISKSDLKTKINSTESGFYRIFYHKNILDHIIESRSDDLNNMNISAMLSDLYFLLKADKISYDYYLEYTNKLLQISPPVDLICDTILTNYGDFKRIIQNDKLIAMYNDILTTYINKFTFVINSTDDVNNVLFKISLLKLGTEVKLDSYINHCVKLFDEFTVKKNNINPNIINIIFRVGLVHRNGFDFLMELLRTDKNFEFDMIDYLGLVNDKLKYHTVLNLFKTDKISLQNKPDIFMASGSNSKLNYLLWPFIRDNWDLIHTTFINYQSGLSTIISSMNYLIGTDELVKEIKSFFESKDKHSMEFAYNNMIELIQNNYKFNKRLNYVYYVSNLRLD